MVVAHPVSLYLGFFYLASTGVSVFEIVEQTTYMQIILVPHTKEKREAKKEKEITRQ